MVDFFETTVERANLGFCGTGDAPSFSPIVLLEKSGDEDNAGTQAGAVSCHIVVRNFGGKERERERERKKKRQGERSRLHEIQKARRRLNLKNRKHLGVYKEAFNSKP